MIEKLLGILRVPLEEELAYDRLCTVLRTIAFDEQTVDVIELGGLTGVAWDNPLFGKLMSRRMREDFTRKFPYYTSIIVNKNGRPSRFFYDYAHRLGRPVGVTLADLKQEQESVYAHVGALIYPISSFVNAAPS